MKSRRWLTLAAGIASFSVLGSLPARAADWMPLTPGTYWVYEGSGGGHQVETITGTRTLRGREVAVKSYSEGTDTGLENYWLLDGDGSVLLAGFTSPGGFGLAYEPPIRQLPVPPVVGPQPTISVTAYDIQTGEVYAQIEIGYSVVEDVTLTIPAGSFHAFGVGQGGAPPGPGLAMSRALALDGRTLPRSQPSVIGAQATDWFSNGVGVVQYQGSDLFQLAYSNLPTPVAYTNWGRVKRLYR